VAKTTTSRPTKHATTPKVAPSAGTDFNLRAIIREAMGTAPYANPGQIAAVVSKRIPKDKVQEALDQSLRFFVRQVMSEERPHGPISGPSRVGAGSPGSAVGATQPSGGTETSAADPKPNGSQSKFTGSRKGSEIRDAWQAVLESKYSTGDGWKSLGDCTYDDLQGMASFLDKQADQKQARARGWRELAALMTDYDVQILRDLPAEVLMKTLGGK
jgi:hypothetical protein